MWRIRHLTAKPQGETLQAFFVVARKIQIKALDLSTTRLICRKPHEINLRLFDPTCEPLSKCVHFPPVTVGVKTCAPKRDFSVPVVQAVCLCNVCVRDAF